MKDACRTYRKLISLEMDGEIDPHDHESLERHLRSCSACRAEKDLWRRIRSLLPTGDTVSSGGIAGQVMDGIRRRRLEAERALPLIRRTAAAAAIVIVASVGALFVLPEKPRAEAVAPRASRDLGHTFILGHTSGPARELTLDEGGDPR